MEWTQYLLDEIDFSDLRVMDAGTGTGRTTSLLAGKVAETGGKGRILSVDIDPETFPEAKRMLGEHARFVEFVKADLTCMPQIESESFDLIVCTETLCALNDRPLKALKGLAEFYRVLRKGGLLIIADDCPLPTAATPEQEVQVMRWQMYKAIAELTGEGHYTEIYPDELESAASLVGFRNIEWRTFAGGPLQQDTMEEWRKVIPPMVNEIGDEQTREAFLALISKICKKYKKEGGRDASSYIMKMRK